MLLLQYQRTNEKSIKDESFIDKVLTKYLLKVPVFITLPFKPVYQFTLRNGISVSLYDDWNIKLSESVDIPNDICTKKNEKSYSVYTNYNLYLFMYFVNNSLPEKELLDNTDDIEFINKISKENNTCSLEEIFHFTFTKIIQLNIKWEEIERIFSNSYNFIEFINKNPEIKKEYMIEKYLLHKNGY